MITSISITINYTCSRCHQAHVLCAWDCLAPACIMIEACADMACMTQAGKAIGMQLQTHYTMGQLTCGRAELFNLKQYVPQDVSQSLRGVCSQASCQGQKSFSGYSAHVITVVLYQPRQSVWQFRPKLCCKRLCKMQAISDTALLASFVSTASTVKCPLYAFMLSHLLLCFALDAADVGLVTRLPVDPRWLLATLGT